MSRAILLALAVATLPIGPVLAHHSFAMFDQRQDVVLRGTVSEFQWTNPHAFIEMDVIANERSQHWSIELNSPNNLRRQGWSRTSLRAGDRITLTMNPLRNGAQGGLFRELEKADGTRLSAALPRGQAVNVPQT